jgi:hypothetical protein
MKYGIHDNQTYLQPKQVFYEGTAALYKGQAVCYNRDVYTSVTGEAVTDAWGKREKYVNLPSTTNNGSFAGVVAEDYAAQDTGREIVIYEPTSVCLVKVLDATTTIGDKSYLTFIVGGTYAGYWTALGASKGKGTAKVLQTLAVAGACMVELMDGDECGGVELTTPAAAGGAIVLMVGGASMINGGTINDAHATFTLADGTYIGQRKYFEITTLVGNSKNVVITVTNGLKIDDTALSTITLNADDGQCLLEWQGKKWKIISSSGATIA